MTEEEVGLLREAEEVRIETSRGPDAPVHRTTIWVVVDERDRVLVRSVRGERGRWYREVLANPECALLVARHRIPFRAEPAGDEERIRACSEALRRKYAADPALGSMLRPETLPTTLQLRPVP
ncbi:MAG TPA: nitroreductase/quinone reductase family protein [candidate division Zixibacteria bacterium]|nr:nitroreductase/quinone reductase family protein [candidate division Zixibacteria bacterium]